MKENKYTHTESTMFTIPNFLINASNNIVLIYIIFVHFALNKFNYLPLCLEKTFDFSSEEYTDIHDFYPFKIL